MLWYVCFICVDFLYISTGPDFSPFGLCSFGRIVGSMHKFSDSSVHKLAMNSELQLDPVLLLLLDFRCSFLSSEASGNVLFHKVKL